MIFGKGLFDAPKVERVYRRYHATRYTAQRDVFAYLVVSAMSADVIPDSAI